MPTGNLWTSSFHCLTILRARHGAGGSTPRVPLPRTSSPGRRRLSWAARPTGPDRDPWWWCSSSSRRGESDNRDRGEDALMKHGKLMAAAGMIGLLCAGSGAAADYETQQAKPVKDAIAPDLATGPDYQVNDPVVADGYMYRFNVTSTYGPFQVTGIGALIKLRQEIWAIGQLKGVTRSEAFLKAAVDQAGKPIVFVKDVVTKPVDTLSGIPKGVGRLFSNVATSVTTTRKPSQESRTKEALQVGAFKREYAARYGVDPYSTNAVLQEELDKIGKAASFGMWTTSAAMIPISGPASSVLTGTSLAKSFNNILATEPPSRIRNINEEKLKQMGVSDDGAKHFLDSPVYTPRQSLLLVDSLSRLGSATGREAYLHAALVAADEVEANFFVNTAQILRGYAETREPITGLTIIRPLAIAQTKSGTAMIPFALDYGVWTANADRISKQLKTTYRAPGFNARFEFWVTGSLSPKAKQELEARGFVVKEQVGSLFDTVY